MACGAHVSHLNVVPLDKTYKSTMPLTRSSSLWPAPAEKITVYSFDFKKSIIFGDSDGDRTAVLFLFSVNGIDLQFVRLHVPIDSPQ